MKKFFLILLIPFQFACAQTKDYKSDAIEVYNDIRKGNYAKVVALFDTSVSNRIDTAKLREVWQNMEKMSGPFVKVIETTTDHQPNYDVVIQKTQFEKRKIDFKLVYGTNQKIKGLSFLPGEPREQYKLPDYHKPDLIKEKPLAVQNGPFRLTGVLAAPKKDGKFPLVILVHGSGPNDKDETVGPTKIFKDLAVGLAAKDLVVYRFDKRTRLYGAKMKKEHNLTVKEETIDDVIAAIKMLKTDSLVDSTKIFIVGHSLGGMLLPRIASKVSNVKGLIYLAANGRPLEDLIFEQTAYILTLDSTSKNKPALLDSIKNESAKVKQLNKNMPDSTTVFQLPISYWLDLKEYDPIKSAQELSVPMLFLNGARDYQVTETDFNIWKNALKDKKAQFKMYPELNHFFITGKGKSMPTEYNKKGNVDVVVINDISSWILSESK
jgi:dienelactone hydrolase